MRNDLDTYRQLLRVNKHRLDDELEVQAEVMDRISDRIAKLTALVSEAENHLKVTEARLFREFKDTDDKITDKAADSAVKRHRERDQAFNRATEATQELAQWIGLHQAWKARGFSIGSLCNLYVAQYFTKDSHSISARSDRRRGEEEALRERPARSEGARTFIRKG